METRVMFLIVLIIAIYLLFSKSGINFIKKIVGMVKDTSTETTPKTDGKVYSGGTPAKDGSLSGGIIAGWQMKL